MKIRTDNGISDIDVPVLYCSKHDAYYITEETYNMISRKGVLCHRVVTWREFVKIFDRARWNENTIMKSYGYLLRSRNCLDEETVLSSIKNYMEAFNGITMSSKAKIKTYAKNNNIAAQVVLQNYMFECFCIKNRAHFGI